MPGIQCTDPPLVTKGAGQREYGPEEMGRGKGDTGARQIQNRRLPMLEQYYPSL